MARRGVSESQAETAREMGGRSFTGKTSLGVERGEENRSIKHASDAVPEREARKIASEMLRPVNQGLITISSATTFEECTETVGG